MAVSESARNDLYNGLRELLGTDRAETLMTFVSAFDPSEIATKSDIARLEERFTGIEGRFESIDRRFTAIDRRFEAIDRRFDDLGKRIDRILLTLAAGLFVIFASVMGVLGVVIAAVT
jgi:membrane-bound lytic murein transglycosylase MltF